MKMSLYTIFDVVAGEAGPVFTAKNDEVAGRSVRATMPKEVDPADFRLYCIGDFDTESMEITGEMQKAREVYVAGWVQPELSLIGEKSV